MVHCSSNLQLLLIYVHLCHEKIHVCTTTRPAEHSRVHCLLCLSTACKTSCGTLSRLYLGAITLHLQAPCAQNPHPRRLSQGMVEGWFFTQRSKCCPLPLVRSASANPASSVSLSSPWEAPRASCLGLPCVKLGTEKGRGSERTIPGRAGRQSFVRLG